MLILVIIYLSRHELVHAWQLLEKVNIWILFLLIPGQLLMYYAGGEMMFSYLQAKKSIDHVPGMLRTRMAMEMNFVNHVLPSGGVSGISYMTWRLGKLGVSPGRAAMAQVVRFAMGFMAFIILLAISVVIVTIDGSINRWVILMSSILVTLMVGSILAGVYLVSSHNRTVAFARWLTRLVNGVVRKVTMGRRLQVITTENVEMFFAEIHRDYIALKHDKRILIKPFLWGILFTLGDLMCFWVAFWALGTVVNPAPILIAYGVASLAGFFVITPGGAGAYEAIMVGFLALAGLNQGTAIAGTVLARVILLLGTIIGGYVFYQLAILKYGKHDDASI